MLTLEEVQKKLEPMNLKEVSRGSGVEYMQVWKISTGRYIAVPYEAVKALSDYLESLP